MSFWDNVTVHQFSNIANFTLEVSLKGESISVIAPIFLISGQIIVFTSTLF